MGKGPGLSWLPAQIVAGFRLVLALILVIAIWADPTQPVRQAELATLCLASYSAWALGLLAIAFRNWWIDFRLARTALVVDCLAEILAVYFTEGVAHDFTPPVAAVFVFVLVSATVLGGWRTALLVGVVVPLATVAVAALLLSNGVPVDPMQVSRRFGFFLVIAALVVWYGGRRSLPAVPSLVTVPRLEVRLPLQEALDYACATFGAGRAIIRWHDRTEPETVAELSSGDEAASLLPLPPNAGTFSGLDAPSLGMDNGAVLSLDPGHRFVIARGEGCNSLVPDGWDEALAIPVTATEGAGVVMLGELRSPGRDLLPLAVSVGREIGAAFDRHGVSLNSYEVDLGRLRQSVARDLHDSVAQSLAGALFRTEAAQKAITGGKDPHDELAKITQALRSEQRHVRTIIERLRAGSELRVRHDLGIELEQLVQELASQWGLAARLSPPHTPIQVGTTQLGELRQIVREAFANAVRHGRATEVRFALGEELHAFTLDVEDNGKVDGEGAGPFSPRSIAERVGALGGKIEARRGPAGARLYINVPRLSA